MCAPIMAPNIMHYILIYRGVCYNYLYSEHILILYWHIIIFYTIGHILSLIKYYEY